MPKKVTRYGDLPSSREELGRRGGRGAAAFRKRRTKYSISGNILDSEDTPIAGAVVKLSGRFKRQTTTDLNGDYIFEELYEGTYRVTAPDDETYLWSPAYQAAVIDGADVVDVDFVGGVYYEISGNIVDGLSAAIEGVLVTLSGDDDATALTDENGDYSFIEPDGDYVLTPTAEGYAFTPDHIDVTVAAGDETGNDFEGAGS